MTSTGIRAVLAKVRAARAAAVDRADAAERRMGGAVLVLSDSEMKELESEADAHRLQADRLSATIAELTTQLASQDVSHMTPIAISISVELADSLGSAAAALAERDRLISLQDRIAADGAKAEAAARAASAAAESAETDLLLTDGAPSAKARKAAEAARATADSAIADAARYGRAASGIGPRLAAADAAIAEARQTVQALHSEFSKDAVAAYESALVEAIAGLVSVLRAGHALAAVGFGSRVALDDIRVPADHIRDLVNGARVELVPGDVEMLERSWHDDAAARALFDAYRPVRAVVQRLATEGARLDRAAADAVIAANAASRAAFLAAPGSGQQHRGWNTAAPEPVASTFVPNSYGHREPGTVVPSEIGAAAAVLASADQFGWDAALARSAG